MGKCCSNIWSLEPIPVVMGMEDFRKIKQLAEDRNWGVGHNGFSFDRGNLTIRRNDISLYNKTFIERCEDMRLQMSTKFRLDEMMVDRIREILPHLVGKEIKIKFVDYIGKTFENTITFVYI